MSKKGLRDFRPEMHFTPEKMWINDPNGMYYANGEYHLFYQYHPYSTIWGPMHWGHAVSEDLIHWTHKPVALAPDALGTIYSGSCVYDENNTSGFGALGIAPAVAIYTQDLQGPGDRTNRVQHQSIAYTLNGTDFIKYEGNPVIPCPEGIVDFRDPKVFRNPVKGGWSMVLSQFNKVVFFHSENLKEWEKTGEFGPLGKDLIRDGYWECPDLFELDTEEGKKTVLIVSLSASSATGKSSNKAVRVLEPGGSRTCYFLGSFDGDTFHMDEGTRSYWLDEGFDNYAGVTFDHAPERMIVGWASNWLYARETPQGEYCGSMTLARKLSLVKTSAGYRLRQDPVGLEKLIGEVRNLHASDILESETFALSISGEGDGEVVLSNSVGQKLVIGVQNNKLVIDRSEAGEKEFSEIFAQPEYQRKEISRIESGKWTIDIVFDRSQLETFMDQNTLATSSLVFPDTPYTRIHLHGEKISGRYLELKP